MYGSLWCNVLRSADSGFCATDTFPGTFINFRFMFTQVLMKELAHMLIHVHKIFNCRASFEKLLSMCLVNYGEVTSNIAAIK